MTGSRETDAACSAFQSKNTPQTKTSVVCFMDSVCNYSAGTIAPLGQVSEQEPQSKQAPASIT